MHRFTSDRGIEFIKHFEGCSLNLYKCSAGHPTIGYGHKLNDNEDFDFISADQAENILRNDLIIIERSVLRNISSPLSDNQFDALVSFTFNLGPGALQRSTLRQKINDNFNYTQEDIYNQFIKWIYASGQRNLGLLRRREAEAHLYLTGEYLYIL